MAGLEESSVGCKVDDVMMLAVVVIVDMKRNIRTDMPICLWGRSSEKIRCASCIRIHSIISTPKESSPEVRGIASELHSMCGFQDHRDGQQGEELHHCRAKLLSAVA